MKTWHYGKKTFKTLQHEVTPLTKMSNHIISVVASHVFQFLDFSTWFDRGLVIREDVPLVISTLPLYDNSTLSGGTCLDTWELDKIFVSTEKCGSTVVWRASATKKDLAQKSKFILIPIMGMFEPPQISYQRLTSWGTFKTVSEQFPSVSKALRIIQIHKQLASSNFRMLPTNCLLLSHPLQDAQGVLLNTW